MARNQNRSISLTVDQLRRYAPELATHFVHRELVENIVSTEKSYRQTAALGVLAHTGCLDDTTVTILAADLEQLFGREPFVSGTPMPFCMDGVALAGIMLQDLDPIK